MLNEKELYSNVHFDSFYKYARNALGLTNLNLIQSLYRGERVRPNRTRQYIIKQTWLNFLTPGPKKLFEDYTWRGEIFGESYKEDILVFAEDVQQEDSNLTMQTIENVLEESFETMEPGEKIQIRSVPTFFVSSYFEDFLHRMSALEYKLKRKLREKLKSILLTLRNRKT